MPKKDNRKPFANRHIGPRLEDIEVMLTTLGYSSMSNFIEDVVPADIRLSSAFSLNGDASGIGRNSQAHIAKSESEALSALKELASQNEVFRSFIGMGYYNCLVPPSDSTEHSGEPRLVHTIHTLSSRDFAGTFGSIT